MIIITILVFIIYILINTGAYLKFNEKKSTFSLKLEKENTNYVFLRWLLLILINAVFIFLLPLSNTYFDVQGEQALIDSLATIGFVITILMCISIYLYMLRFKNVMNITHSLGIILLYSIEFALMLMFCLYFVVS